jgi:primosomal protein N' (replication factor Y)
VTGRVARVLPNVTGLDKSFDYLIPDDLAGPPRFGPVRVGTVVRVELHGRRIGGWISEILDVDDAAVDRSSLKPIAKVTGHGPDAEVFELAEWASVRWAARRSRPFLVAASPGRAITSLPPDRRTAPVLSALSPATTDLLASGGGVLRLPPRSDVLPALRSAIAHGPTLVVTPTIRDARLLATRLRRSGASVALMPDDWAAAMGGVDVVIGPRSAAWAPCPDMASAVVIDEHDEALQEERAPTWHARDVVVERCRRSGIPHLLISPAPTLTALVTAGGAGGVVHPPFTRERAAWPKITVVDRTNEEPWKKSLVTSTLIDRLRDPDLTVVCISNITGRARVLACRSCEALIRCETCDAAVGLTSDNVLACTRCGTNRPAVCQACGASNFANLRPGVSRLREELEGAAARPVVEITGADAESLDRPAAGVYVGTEAALYRVSSADVVAFLEFDSEMLAPRFRAAEQALALIIRAGRLAPEVLVQTFVPDHVVLQAAAAGNPDEVVRVEREQREMLGLPPFGALASVSGTGSSEVVGQLGSEVQVGGDETNGFVVRADDWTTLGTALNATERPKGSRVRVAVDPPRL